MNHINILFIILMIVFIVDILGKMFTLTLPPDSHHWRRTPGDQVSGMMIDIIVLILLSLALGGVIR